MKPTKHEEDQLAVATKTRPKPASTEKAPLKRARIPHYDTPAKVGKRLVEAREAKGFSQRDLSFPGCSAAYISRVERGERVPSGQVMQTLADKLGVTAQFLAYGKDLVDPEVQRIVRVIETAKGAAKVDAYKDLAKAANKAAKETTKALSS